MQHLKESEEMTERPTISKWLRVHIFLVACLSLLPVDGWSYGWLQKTQISRVTVHDWGDAVFIYTTSMASAENCPGGGNPLILLRSNAQFKEIYAAALAASLTKTTIGGYTYGCDPGHYNLPLLQRIDILADPSGPYP